MSLPKRQGGLGLVSAILGDQTLEEAANIAAAQGYKYLEVMCWPQGSGEERRYAGVCHINVEGFTPMMADDMHAVTQKHGIEICGLGYFANPLSDEGENRVVAAYVQDHMHKVLKAASLMRVPFSTFVGRDQYAGLSANSTRFREFWPGFMSVAESLETEVCVENCPMHFSENEWPAGLNLAHTPAFWEWMFEEIPSRYFGLEYDPAHLVWQEIDPEFVMPKFLRRVKRAHAKDARRDLRRRRLCGITASPLDYHTPCLPGEGDVDWDLFFEQLDHYEGPICVEVEDKRYEGSLKSRIMALRRSREFLSHWYA